MNKEWTNPLKITFILSTIYMALFDQNYPRNSEAWEGFLIEAFKRFSRGCKPRPASEMATEMTDKESIHYPVSYKNHLQFLVNASAIIQKLKAVTIGGMSMAVFIPWKTGF